MEIAINVLDCAIVFVDIRHCFLEEAAPYQVEDQDPAEVLSDLLQLDILRAKLFASSA